MRINDEIDEETYVSKKSQLEKEKLRAKDNRDETDNHLMNWRVRVEKAIDLAYGGYLKFKTGTREERHEMLLSIGSNLCVDQRNMRIDLSIHFQEFDDSDNWSEKYEDDTSEP